ncbi:LysR family transcriptional regulator [Sneathiella limimaris]|uniref:LysR family transcriptional regulator n=1 Tax=Sneathiella limimaris TaxID=1964213 RepID=UPI00146EA5BE|nr:LysR family transcriptional regulator [Sneathiella limimaris]
MASPKVSLEQWRILHSIITEGGFAQAAQKLNKSQSAVSYAVAKMQEQLGMEILTIRGRKAELTEAGELLLRRSRTLLEEAENLEAAARSLNQGWEPTISIASEVLFPTGILMRALERLSETAPHTRVEIIESVMSGTEDLILQQAVDLAICSGLPAGVSGVPLMDIQFNLVCSPDHPLAQHQGKVTFQLLSRHRQIIVRDSGMSRRGQGGWQKAEQRWTFSNLGSARQAIVNGHGFAWMPTCLMSNELSSGHIIRLEMETPTKRQATLSLTQPNPDLVGPAARLLYDILLEEVVVHQNEFEKHQGQLAVG